MGRNPVAENVAPGDFLKFAELSCLSNVYEIMQFSTIHGMNRRLSSLRLSWCRSVAHMRP
jgi:hypothetical protein